MKGLGFLRTRIGQRFLAIFLGISLLPLAAMGWFAIHSSEAALRQQTLTVLRTASDGAEAQLREFLEKLHEQILQAAQEKELREAIQATRDPDAGTSSHVPGSSTISELVVRQQGRFADVQELFVIGMDGRVLASSSPENIGKDLSSAEFFQKGLRGFFPGDVKPDPGTGQTTWILTAPIQMSAQPKVLGVLAFRIDPETLSDLTSGRRVLAEGANTQSFRVGQTGETYIVNRSRLMITESRYLSNAVLRVKVDSLPVRAFLDRGEEVMADYIDYRGVQVSGASMVLQDMGWVVITELDFKHAFLVIHRLERGLLQLGAALGLLVGFLAWNSTRRIIRPIQMLRESDRGLARGEEAAAFVSEEGLPNDEIGELVRQRNLRVKALAETQRELMLRSGRLRDMIRELEHVSHSIMHDMRAPLRALSSFGDVIVSTEAERLSPEGRHFLGRMKAAATRMDRLICDVLSYNSLVLADLPLAAVNVSELLRGMLQTYPMYQPNHAEILFPSDLPLVHGNEAALTQCFSNLLDNAIKFTQPGQFPRIEIRAEQKDDWIRIWVEDNGIGIAPDLQERIFGIFQQVSVSQEGTGMGLALVRKAVERMGGRVGVNSEPGKGSRFWIDLRPAKSSDESENPALVVQPAEHGVRGHLSHSSNPSGGPIRSIP